MLTSSPIDLQQMLFGDEPTALTAMDVNRAAARPNHDLPRQVNPDRLLKIFESKECGLYGIPANYSDRDQIQARSSKITAL
jgi:hypothetical protein